MEDTSNKPVPTLIEGLQDLVALRVMCNGSSSYAIGVRHGADGVTLEEGAPIPSALLCSQLGGAACPLPGTEQVWRQSVVMSWGDSSYGQLGELNSTVGGNWR